MNNQLIGIFDSGIGGLSVLNEINMQLPNHSFIYLADSAYNPYGNKNREEIIKRSQLLVNKLIDMDVDLIVMACNTATAFAVESIRELTDIPIVAMEPGIKAAAEQSETGNVLILATSMTLSSERYFHLLERFADKSDFIHQPCPGLVEVVENMQVDSEQAEKLIWRYIEPAIKENIDAIVLGCTHYPFLKYKIKSLLKAEINIIDTSKAVTKQVLKKIQELKNPNTDEGQKELSQLFLTTGDLDKYKKQLNHYWKKPVDLNHQVKSLEIVN